ncbi:MAG TPA: ABC transporter substrate-binding protein, partial [Acidimicrobiales bacterium]|nr:ABC transporter substrate-binding protein [Acidimicrobiales bacterium]
AVGMTVLVGATGVACSSTKSSSSATTSAGGGGSKIPASAFSDHTGITATSVELGNISTLDFGLFKGAAVGTQAYADYVNSTGGINGRTLKVNSANDGYNNGANNKALTQSALQTDFALVGGFSLNDSFGGTVLAQNPGMPDVSVTLDPTTNQLANVVSPVPLGTGWELGPLQYFKQKFPTGVTAVGSLVANQPSAEAQWAGEKAAMEHVGYKVIYDNTFPITQTDFTPNVIAMKNAGVKVLFIEQMPVNYASAVIKALNQQNYHPTVVLGASTYSATLVSTSGGAAATNGDYLEQNASLYLGEDQSTIPAVGTFLKWVNVADPGFKPDLFTLYGWVSAQLYAQGLQNAGTNPSRGSLLQALSKVTSYSANSLIAPTNPAQKANGNCYLLAQIQGGQIQRIDDPPVTGTTHGYRCDYSYYAPAS